MSVDLTQIPPPLPEPKKMNLWRWAIAFLVVMVVGSLVTLAISQFYSLSDFWLWFGLTAAPFITWLLVFLYCLYLNGCRQYYVIQWNKRHEQRRDELITFAQRPLYVLENYLYTQYGKAGNAKGVSSLSITMESLRPHAGGNAVPHSALPLEHDVSESDFIKRLTTIVSDIKTTFGKKLVELSSANPLHIRLFIDTPLKDKEVQDVFHQVWEHRLNYTSLSVEPTEQSHLFLDKWLDNTAHDNALLLVIGCHLFSYPQPNSAEVGTAFLLAGKNIIKNKRLLEDILSNNHTIAEVFRTEHQIDVEKLLDNALLWGAGNKSALTTLWYSNITPEVNVKVLTYFSSKKITLNNHFNLDTSIGHANYCAYWLTLAIAIEQAIESKEKQLAMCGSSDISALVVSTYMPNESIKDK
ncbi:MULTISPECIES: hypothetical protein [Limnobaculum]|uniref:Uncharacterized protein n=2 Tax=Limnobaculum TaxID=2172100 RepID=A0A2Y9TUC2_9GAMM|nr:MULTISPECIES: hypothetical protein [Limnobaculum]AWH87236.1 hypothetical protein HYN51_00880 [Limnobaculum parvum]MCD1126588.1 hypothetical protein [Limnobaculum eriocheiris]